MPASSSPSRIRSCWASQPKAKHLEAVDQGDQAAVPVAVVQVDGVDPGRRAAGHVGLGTLARHALDPGRVDQLHGSGRAPATLRPRRRSGWHSHSRALGAHVAGAGHHLESGGRVLHVEGQLEVGAATRVELGEGGDVVGQLAPGQLGDATAPGSPAHHAVVVEHRLPVGGEPDVALQPGGAQPRAASRKASRVFSGAWARAPRWAKPIGGRSEGSRGTAPSMPRRRRRRAPVRGAAGTVTSAGWPVDENGSIRPKLAAQGGEEAMTTTCCWGNDPGKRRRLRDGDDPSNLHDVRRRRAGNRRCPSPGRRRPATRAPTRSSAPAATPLVVKPAQPRTIDLLLASGVEYDMSPPDRGVEHDGRGPRLTHRRGATSTPSATCWATTASPLGRLRGRRRAHR